jgi:hypothetical protein
MNPDSTNFGTSRENSGQGLYYDVNRDSWGIETPPMADVDRVKVDRVNAPLRHGLTVIGRCWLDSPGLRKNGRIAVPFNCPRLDFFLYTSHKVTL